MERVTAAAVAVLAGAAASAAVLGVDLDPGIEASISAPLFSASFGVSGWLGVEVEMDGDGKLSNAGLSAVDLLIASAGLYDFGPGGLLRLTNIGITMEARGDPVSFYNETSGVPQPGDYAGFQDAGAVAALTGEFGVDIDGDGVEEITWDLSAIDGEYRTFDFIAQIIRDGGSSLYTLSTQFILEVDPGFLGQPLPIMIEYTGGGQGMVPGPGTLAALGIGLVGARRRR